MNGGAMNYYVRIAIGCLFSFRSSAKWFDTFDKAIQHKNELSLNCCLATGRKIYFGEIFTRKQFFPGVYGMFQNEEVLVLRSR